MSSINVEKFHKLYGTQRRRTNYQNKDFSDYLIMLVICAAVMFLGYGLQHVLSWVGAALCVFMAVTFPINHGFALRMPLLLRAPQEAVYLLIHKVQNIKAPYFIAIAILVAENLLIYYTPTWPHYVDWMRRIALVVFWGHLLLISGYRTAILIAHLRKRDHVREVLAQSAWKGRVETPRGTTFSMFHGYMTGLVTHLVYLVPWYVVITHANFSLVLTPVTIAIAFLVQKVNVKTLNDWFYRDHWLSHNSEIDFVYMHGVHHDAIPSGMIAVAGNGPLEGLARSGIAFPIPFYNPIAAALFYTVDVKSDMDLHQYIPGVFPKLPREFLGVIQHSLHHFGRLEPYGFAINLDQPISEDLKKMTKVLPDELKYSIRLDQSLNDYEWDNPKFKWYMALVDRYHDAPDANDPGAERQPEGAAQ
jgi:hypothetical protein